MLKDLIAKLFKKYPPEVKVVQRTHNELHIEVRLDKLLHEVKRLQGQVTSLQNSQTKMYRELKEKRWP